MRVFVCEFVTGGGLAGAPLPPGLHREGDMMLRALVKDLAALPGVAVTITRDRRLDDPALPAALRWIGDGEDPWVVWQDCMNAADAVWPVAPETGGSLVRLSRAALGAGRLLLGSRPDAVRLAASKRSSAAHLAACGIATVETRSLTTSPPDRLPESDHGWVVKPDDGAGSEETFHLPTRADLRRWLAARRDAPRFVLQPFVAGRAASLTLLCRDGGARLLACNTQEVVPAGDRLTYRGGTVGGAEDRREQYQPIAAAVAAALPGLWGHVGIDLIDTEGGPLVVDINPRLTTSYAGLRTALGVNPAELVLRILDHGLEEAAAELHHIPAPVRIDADAA